MGDKVDEIIITLDTHNRIHIAHGIFWTSESGQSPPPFTAIKEADILSRKWVPKDPSYTEYCEGYCRALEETDKQSLVIWPEHCIIGTQGHNVVDCINEAIAKWTEKKGKNVDYVMKGQNTFTEHYSALQADVPIESDKATMLNLDLVSRFKKASTIICCGQAMSHCVNHTVRDMLVNMEPADASKIVLLEDAMSSVTGFDAVARQFEDCVREKGVAIESTADYKL